jgi:hypothetical protein
MCGGGGIVDIALPILGAVVGGPLGAGALGGALGTGLGTAVGAGLGSTAGSLVTGKSIGDSLKGGALSGATAGISSALGLNEALGNLFNFSTAADPAFLAAGDVVGAHGALGAEGLASGLAGAPASVGGGFTGAPESLGMAWGAGSPDLTQALDAFGGIGPDIAGATVDSGFASALPGGVTSQALPSFDPFGMSDVGALGQAASGGGSAVSEASLLGIESDIDKLLQGAQASSLPGGGMGLDLSGASEMGTVGIPGVGEATNVGYAPGVVEGATPGAQPWADPSYVDPMVALQQQAAADIGSNPDVFGGKTGIQSILSTLGIDKPGKLILPGLALGAAALRQGPTDEQKALLKLAQQQSAQSSQLQGYLASGTLPPGAQAGLDQAAQSAKAAIKSQYARMGLSGSTMERQALAGVDERMKAQGFNYAAQLLNAGIKDADLSGQLYNYLVRANQTQDAGLQQAIANFVGASAA